MDYCGLYEECLSLDDTHKTAISGDRNNYELKFIIIISENCKLFLVLVTLIYLHCRQTP